MKKSTRPEKNRINIPAKRVASTEIVDDDEPSEKLYNLIAQQPFFEGLSVSHLQLLTKSALKMQFEPGRQIFREGEPSNRFYLILEGKVEVESESEKDNKVSVGTLGPGDGLGWSWLFPPHYAQFSMRAIATTKTIFFYGTRLQQQCEDDHDFGYEIMKRFANEAIKNLKSIQEILVERTNTKGV
jgi:CRP/FNR family cyclic AMP-dependent transcriptional regulator